VNEFVEECRREWERLGVPDPVANEMAADLAADLKEAEAEGVAAEEVLGSGAFDPRSFARAWADARGVIERPPLIGYRLPRRSPVPGLIAVFAVIAVIGAVLAIYSSQGQAWAALASPVGPMRVGPSPRSEFVQPPAPAGRAGQRVLPAPQQVPERRTVAVDLHGSGTDTHKIGAVMLIVGLAGIVLTMLFWLTGRGYGSRPSINGHPTRSA
jgi:hypothetical protein